MFLRLAARRGLATAAAAATGAAASSTAQPAAPLPPRGYHLVHATVFFRHGARAPVHVTNADGTPKPGSEGVVYDDWSEQLRGPQNLVGLDGGEAPVSSVDKHQQATTLPGGCRSGELTKRGYAQARALGEMLRQIYAFDPPPKLVGGKLMVDFEDKPPTLVGVRSTNVSRCVNTARGVLDGLLGGAAAAAEVPISTAKNEDEDLTPNPKRCARLGELWASARDEWPTKWKDHVLAAPVLAHLVANGLTERDRELYRLERGSWVPFKDVILSVGAQPSTGGVLPFGVDADAAPDNPSSLAAIDTLAAAQVGFMMGVGRGEEVETETNRLSLGAALGRTYAELVERAEAAAGAAAAPATLRLVSGHDTTILPTLTALRLWDGSWPPFCSALSFELWVADADETAPPLLRVLYNGAGGGVYSSTKVAEAHGAFNEIARWTLDEFGEVVARVVPANHAAECTKVESPEFAQKLLRAAQAGGSQF